MASLELLSDDVLFLILSFLQFEHSSILQVFRLTSRRLNFFAESIKYRTLVLEDETVYQDSASYGCVERLRDLNDPLCHYVRFLVVKSFQGDSKSFSLNTNFLLECLQNIHRLDSFSWEAEHHLNDDLVKSLARLHPKAALCATVTNLDQPLLTSQQLRRLSISIPCSNVSRPVSNKRFEQLREVVLNLPNLRSLSVDVHQDFKLVDFEHDGWPEKCGAGVSSTAGTAAIPCKIQIPFRPGDKVPPLEELSFETNSYLFDEEHCTVLFDCIDWTKVKTLKLAPIDTHLLFQYLLGRTPQLQHLDVAAASKRANNGLYVHPDYQTDLQDCSQFLSSVVALQALTVRCDIVDFTDEFWTNLSNLSDDLQSLSILPRVHGLDPPQIQCLTHSYSDQAVREANQLRKLLQSLSNLTALRLSLPSWNDYSRCESCAHDPHHLFLVYTRAIPYYPPLKKLQTLHISTKAFTNGHFHLRTHATNNAHCTIRQLWSYYHNESQGTSLHAFEFEFWRWQPTPVHPDELGFTSGSHIDSIVLKSRRQGQHLTIRARHKEKTMTTTYTESEDGSVQDSWEGKPLVYYVPQGQPPMDNRDLLVGTTARKGRKFPWFKKSRK